MTHKLTLTSLSRILTVLVIIAAIVVSSVNTQTLPALEVRVIDTAIAPGQTGVELPVYLKNYTDSIAGFAIWLQVNQPGKIVFHPDVITEGCLTQDWEYVYSRHLGTQPYDLKIIGMANLPDPPHTPAFPPQNGQIPLVKFLIDTEQIPDTATDRTVELFINHDQLFNFNFSDPNGQSIGILQDSTLDTAYYQCTAWLDQQCLNWEQTLGPPDPYDSMYIYWNFFTYLDPERVFVIDGSITLTGGFLCGDTNNSGAGPDISDLVYFVQWFFAGGPPLAHLLSADCDGSGIVDISDIVYLTGFMFLGGPPPACSN